MATRIPANTASQPDDSLLQALLAQQPHARPAAPDPSLDLLGALLSAPPAPATNRLAPVALRSVDEQRAHALRGFMQRTWFDRALAYAERGLIIAALLVFGWWFADGPVRDWLHARSTSTAVTSAAPQHTPVLAAPPAAALPFVPDQKHPAVAPEVFAPAAPAAEDSLAPRNAAPGGPIAVSPLPTHLIIPAIALDSPVQETFVVDGVWQVADYAAGYMHGTTLPNGDSGNTALAGHAGIRGSVFADIGQLHPGDDIFLDAGGWRYQYRVHGSTSVWPTQTEVLAPTEKPTLTLITCTNWDTQRLVVTAELTGAVPTPGT